MLLNTKYYSDSSTSTYLMLTKFATAVRNSSVGYDVSIEFKIVTGAYTYDATDRGKYLKLVFGALSYKEGYSHWMQRKNPGGDYYDISKGTAEFAVKRKTMNDDNFTYNSTYYYKLDFYGIPYSTLVGSKNCSLYIADMDTDTRRDPISWGYAQAVSAAHTFQSATVSSAPQTLRRDGVTATLQFPGATIPANTDLTWVRPTTYLPNISKYKIYMSKNGGTWGLQAETTGLSYVIPTDAVLSGETRSYRVTAVNIYGLESTTSSTVSLQRTAVTDIIYVRVDDDDWRSGQLYVRTGVNTWKPATEVRARIGTDSWKVGIK
jgi:hypothetical protein